MITDEISYKDQTFAETVVINRPTIASDSFSENNLGVRWKTSPQSLAVSLHHVLVNHTHTLS